MSSRNVLVVVLDPVPDERIRSAVQAREEVADVTVHVVAPAAGVGVLQWLTGAEDEARAEADERASRTADAVDVEVETEVGDRDPLVAVQDALAAFPADEIVLAGEASAEIEAKLRRFDLPVSRLNGAPAQPGEETGTETVAREVARGGSPQTPVLLLGVVGGVLLVAILLISLITFLVSWVA
jgi:hypothetical protein